MTENQTIAAEAPEELSGRVAIAKKLGFWMCTALVVGKMIGSGEFLLPVAAWS